MSLLKLTSKHHSPKAHHTRRGIKFSRRGGGRGEARALRRLKPTQELDLVHFSGLELLARDFSPWRAVRLTENDARYQLKLT